MLIASPKSGKGDNWEVSETLTQSDIEAGLHQLGVKAGDVLEVHTALSKFGQVEAGAKTVVDALFSVVGPSGAIVMSAYPISKGRPLSQSDIAKGITYKAEHLSEDSNEATNVGAVVDEFRRRPDVILGKGVHRGAAWGSDAELHSCGYEHLLKVGGKVLLMGVGIGNCSSMHIPLERIGLPVGISALSKLPGDVLDEYPDDKWYVECSRVVGTPRNAWEVVWGEALLAGLVRSGKIGESACHLFTARDVVGIYERHLLSDPWTLYGVPHSSIKYA